MNTQLKAVLTGRLLKTQAHIVALEDALLLATEKGVASFEIDTGEGRHKVVMRNAESIQRALDTLYAREEMLIRRLNNRTSISVRVRRKP